MHTKGQMKVRISENAILTNRGPFIDDAGNVPVCEILGAATPWDGRMDFARRIVALWNMAHRLNLSTEFIEDGGVDEMALILRVIVTGLRKCRISEDEIIAAENILSKMGR